MGVIFCLAALNVGWIVCIRIRRECRFMYLLLTSWLNVTLEVVAGDIVLWSLYFKLICVSFIWSRCNNDMLCYD